MLAIDWVLGVWWMSWWVGLFLVSWAWKRWMARSDDKANKGRYGGRYS